MSELPITVAAGVRLTDKGSGIAGALVTSPGGEINLPWDRYVRLRAAARQVQAAGVKRVLDVGGFDGALAFFLPGIDIDVVDPATTGGSILDLRVEADSYDAIVAVDVLEHIVPQDRAHALAEFARVAHSFVIINYPCRDSKDAQILALELTGNALIKEHVDWDLPDSQWVLAELKKHGFEGILVAHSSIAIWLGQFIVLNQLPDASAQLNRHLVENFSEEPFSQPLYHLICARAAS